MKIAIIGSRSLHNVADLEKYIPLETTLIISGGAKGIDALAEKYAAKNGIHTKIIKPEYEKYKRYAPLKRNQTIVEACDVIIAFWDGKSKGTKYTIDYALKAGKPVRIYTIC